MQRGRGKTGKLLGWLGGILFWFVALGVLAHLLNLDDLVRASIAAGHLLDWILGVVCFLWLLVVLKAVSYTHLTLPTKRIV